MDVRVYSLEELEDHIQASKSEANLVSPLSPLRLQSYLNNPRAHSGDPVLFELHIKDKLVAYRSLLPDTYRDIQGTTRPFAWLSGNWVDPAHRRQGYSTRLLQEAESRWDGRLMYTNYAPASKAVYDRTGNFPLLRERKGKRFYLRAAAKELLGERLGGRNLLRIGDRAINHLREKKLQQFEEVNPELCQIEKVSSLDHKWRELIAHRKKESLFGRDADVFDWILSYPWITTSKVPPLNYHFSYQAGKFENTWLSFTLPNQSKGLLWLLVHNQALSVPYVFAESEQCYTYMARTLVHYMISRNCAYTTIRHASLVKETSSFGKLFLSTRDMPQLIFAHKNIVRQVAREREIQDGDGDVVFTG